MKPLNYNDSTCSPISSNCVIWQGPDIECISLCKGDSVSEVIYKLATELCSIMETLEVTSYDLSCLNLTSCTPENFEELLQLLIDRICALEGCCNGTTPSPTEGCPDCVVNIAPCFYFTNQLGDLITTMQLTDYVQAIGSRVCQIVDQIATINATLANHESRITYIEENCCDTSKSAEQLILPVCVLPPNVPVPVETLVKELEEQYCQLVGATGDSNDIYQAIVKQCSGLSSASQLSGVGNMSGLSGWAPAVQNLADAISNIWLTICDVRSAVAAIQVNCCPTGCQEVYITMTATLAYPNITLFFNGTVPVGFQPCNVLGTPVTFTDGTNTIGPTYINVLANLNSISGVTIDVSALNNGANITVDASYCFFNNTNGFVQCESVNSYTVINSASCPSPVTLGSTETTVSYGFTAAFPATYTVQIAAQGDPGTILDSTIFSVLVPAPINGVFSLLTPGTNYIVRVNVDTGSGSTNCNWTVIATLPPVCGVPTNIVPTII